MKDESMMMRGECVGGRQEHHRVPAVQETFLYGKKKGVCTRSGCVGVWSVMEGGTHEKVALCGKTPFHT